MQPSWRGIVGQGVGLSSLLYAQPPQKSWHGPTSTHCHESYSNTSPCNRESQRRNTSPQHGAQGLLITLAINDWIRTRVLKCTAITVPTAGPPWICADNPICFVLLPGRRHHLNYRDTCVKLNSVKVTFQCYVCTPCKISRYRKREFFY